MIRVLLSGLVALVLAAASVEFAVARGLPKPVGQVVICRGLSVVTVHVDASGDPVRQSTLCPDAAGAIFVDPGLPAAAAPPHRTARPAIFAYAATPAAGSAAPRARARAPPRPV